MLSWRAIERCLAASCKSRALRPPLGTRLAFAPFECSRRDAHGTRCRLGSLHALLALLALRWRGATRGRARAAWRMAWRDAAWHGVVRGVAWLRLTLGGVAARGWAAWSPESSWASPQAYAPLVQVLRLLPLDARARAACVCRAWREAAADGELWKVLRFDDGFSALLDNAALARLCARAGAELRELRLEAPACACVNADDVMDALCAGGCTGVRWLALTPPDGDAEIYNKRLFPVQARFLAAACPALEHAAFCICCDDAEDVAAACALPGPLTLVAEWRSAAACAAMQVSARVASLVVLHVRLDEESIATLGASLGSNTTLATLVLKQSYIRDEDVAVLCASLRANATLKTLQMGGNIIGDAGAASLSEWLSTNKTLTALWLEKNNNIGPAGGAALGEALKKNSTLKTLMLHGTSIDRAGGAALAEGLIINATLTTLNVADSGIHDFGCAALGNALRTNRALTTLDAGGNDIGDAGLVALGEALRTNGTLTTLALANNAIECAGASALGFALRTNASLTTLLLDHNVIGYAGAVSLRDGLRENDTLKIFTLHHNEIGEAGAATLCSALRENCTLRMLRLGNNGISRAAGKTMRDALSAAGVRTSPLLLDNDDDDLSYDSSSDDY